MTTVLVTGGAGMIGGHVVRCLQERGDEVVVLDDLSSGRREHLPPGTELVVGSIVSDDDLRRAFAARPTHVVHLAALFANQKSVEQPEQDLEVNGLGTLKVMRLAVEHGVEKVLHCSSSCVYGEVELAEESMPVSPDETPYGITKALGEDYARYFARSGDLDTVIVRPFNAYGPHERPGPYRNVIPNFFATAMRGEPLRVTGTGDETRDFTYVTDLANGIVLALHAPTSPGEVFNLGTGTQTRIGDLARLVNVLTGNRAPIDHAPRRSWDHTPHRRASIERARATLGFEPVVSLEEGLERTYAWLRTELG